MYSCADYPVTDGLVDVRDYEPRRHQSHRNEHRQHAQALHSHGRTVAIAPATATTAMSSITPATIIPSVTMWRVSMGETASDGVSSLSTELSTMLTSFCWQDRKSTRLNSSH